MKRTLLSWNVNGIRAAAKKGLFTWLAAEKPYLLGVQETKIQAPQLTPELLVPTGYESFWHHAERKGYSGVAAYAAEKPLSSATGFGMEKFDSEGRVVALEYPRFFFLNIYFPNGGMGPERIKYKLEFYAEFLNHAKKLAGKGKALIACGDYNTAHTEIDLAHPKENVKTSGFLPEERAWLDKMLDWGFADTFRVFNKKPGNYTWWDLRTGARARDIGWRIDYFLIDKQSLPMLQDAFIMKEVPGSDHCPIGITIDDH